MATKGQKLKAENSRKGKEVKKFSKIGTLANSTVRLLVFQLLVHVQKVVLFASSKEE